MRRRAGGLAALVASVAAVVAVVVVGGGSSPAPSPTPGGSGFVEVQLEVAPGAEEFFASQHRGRILAADGTALADWEITAAAAPVTVPAGSHQLQVFTVFLSDFIQCSTDPGGASHCAQPTLGPAQVCALPIQATSGATVIARFRSLPEGRCELVPLPSATASPVLPGRPSGSGSAARADARVCAGTGWPPFKPSPAHGITVAVVDRSHLTIRNPTDQAWWYRLSGWETLTLEDCRGLAEVESERGPLPAGGHVDTTFGILDGRLDLPVTLGLWDTPCGEACNRAAIRGLDVTRSTTEPASS